MKRNPTLRISSKPKKKKKKKKKTRQRLLTYSKTRKKPSRSKLIQFSDSLSLDGVDYGVDDSDNDSIGTVQSIVSAQQEVVNKKEEKQKEGKKKIEETKKKQGFKNIDTYKDIILPKKLKRLALSRENHKKLKHSQKTAFHLSIYAMILAFILNIYLV